MSQGRGQFNPGVLVILVCELLDEHGIATVVDQLTAVAAAADLLRALGVRPASAPVLPPPAALG